MAIRHSITLSTSEPNNEVGNLKIRQGDEQTQTLVANITENGVPKPFTGLQPFFCAKLGQTAGLGIIEQKVTGPMNPANGTLEYVMQPEDWQQLGRQTAYFSFRKMVNDHEWTEQFSTRDFNYNVTKSAFSEGLREVNKAGSTYVWTIEDMLRLFKEYMVSGKTDWEEFVEDNREFLETADPGGKIILELLGARGGAGTLGERLDETDVQLVENMNYRTIDSFGAIGDGIADDTEAIRNAVANTPEGSKLLAEGKRYKITDTILVNKQINIEFLGTFLYDGAKDRPAFTFSGLQFKDIKIGKVINANQTTPDWSNSNFIGVEMIDLFNCNISIDEVNNFYVGYKTTTKNAGFWFCDVTIKRAINCLIGHEICSDSDSGWLNNNIFRGLSAGFSGSAYRTDAYYRYSVLQTLKNGNTYGGNTNVFYSYRFETNSSSTLNWTQIKLLKAYGWQFKDTRIEMASTHKFLEVDLSVYTPGSTTASHTNKISFEFVPPILSTVRLPLINIINLKNLQTSISEVVSFNYGDPFKPNFENENILFTDRLKQLTNNHVSLKGLRLLPIQATSLSAEVCSVYYGKDDFPLITSDGLAKIHYTPVMRLLEVKNGDVIKIEVVTKTGKPNIKLFDSAGSIVSDAVLEGAKKIGSEMYYDNQKNVYVYNTTRDEYVISIHSDDIKYLAVLLTGEYKSINIKSNRQNLNIKSSYLFPEIGVRNIVESEVKPTIGEVGYNSIGEIVYNFNRSSGQVIGWQLSSDGESWNALGNRA